MFSNHLALFRSLSSTTPPARVSQLTLIKLDKELYCTKYKDQLIRVSNKNHSLITSSLASEPDPLFETCSRWQSTDGWVFLSCAGPGLIAWIIMISLLWEFVHWSAALSLPREWLSTYGTLFSMRTLPRCWFESILPNYIMWMWCILIQAKLWRFCSSSNPEKKKNVYVPKAGVRERVFDMNRSKQ